MVSALVSLSSGPGWSPGWRHYVVLLGNGDRGESHGGVEILQVPSCY